MYMNSGQLVEFFLNQKINKGVKNNINTKSINKFGLIEIISSKSTKIHCVADKTDQFIYLLIDSSIIWC